MSGFKRVFSAALILYTLYFILCTPVLAAGASFSLSPASGTYQVGSVVSATITLDTAGNGTSGADAILLYEPEKLEAQAIVVGTIYTSYPVRTISATAGKISISGITSDPAASFAGRGTFATVKFKVLSTGTATVRFDFRPEAGPPASSQDSNVAKKGTQGKDILSSVSNATYTLSTSGGGGGVTPAPPTSGVFEITLALILGGFGLFLLGLVSLLKPSFSNG
jgi:hypothetical protein